MMRRAVVTGASGFIGGHLCEHLRAGGWHIVGAVRPSSSTESLRAAGIPTVVLDFARPDSIVAGLGNADVVFHLAGVTRSLDSRELYRVNQDATAILLDACGRLERPPRVVLMSSLAAAGPFVGRPRVEADPSEPVSEYGRSKRGGELVAESYCKRLPITVIRPPIVLGQGDRATLPMFRSVYRSFTHAIPGIVPQRFSIIHVADLVRLVELAASGEVLTTSSEQTGEGYYFADCGEHVTYGQLGQRMGRALGRPWTFPIFVPRPLVWVVGTISDVAGRVRGVPSPLNIDKVREATAGSWWCSGEKAARQLGFVVEATLDERLRETAQWYRDRGWLQFGRRVGTGRTT